MKKNASYQEMNIEAIERWIKEDDWKWGKPIDHDTFIKASKGDYEVLLTPTKFVPHRWLGELKGKRILGLASGGGQQMAIFSALGAKCTVIDLSDMQLESDRLVAEREGYDIEIVKGDISKDLPFEDNSFDMIFSPVSYCYIEKLEPLFKECYRILKPNGTYMFGADNGINFITNDEETISNALPFNPLVNKEQMDELVEDDCGVQFSHSLDELLRQPLKVGFQILDLYEDINDEGRLGELNIPTYVAVLLMKK